ncbi:hypothetical protein TYRP_000152 [Tyrophagus putrescentiae]|nr:hypothetical protein TYRP_000152 [Tyrophagus putrescentiae]
MADKMVESERCKLNCTVIDALCAKQQNGDATGSSSSAEKLVFTSPPRSHFHLLSKQSASSQHSSSSTKTLNLTTT